MTLPPADESDIPTYEPSPIDTSAVSLPADLLPLLEELAENAHDVWARQRRRDGWQLGPVRDDVTKEHPCLVPYSQLPDTEKTYDRLTATETLRAILVLGYRIVPPASIQDADNSAGEIRETMQPAATQDFDAKRTHASITSRDATVRDLLDVWSTHRDDDWAAHPDLYRQFARRLLQLGEPHLARDVIRIALSLDHGNLVLLHLNGLALARSGSANQAHREAEKLVAAAELAGDSISPELFEDIYGLRARLAKDIALDTDDPVERETQIGNAHDAYERAFAKTGGSYSGINAATMALLAGNEARARMLAAHVLAHVRTQLPPSADYTPAHFWKIATLAEASLLLGNYDEARRHYEDAHRVGGDLAPGDIGSTRRQARLILAHRGEATDWIDEALGVPTVVVFAGHRIGARFPSDIEAMVRAEIMRRLPANARIGFSGAADGAEILFQEIMRERRAQTYVVLPFGESDFLETSVAEGWSSRFQQVKEAATEVIVATPQRSVDQGLLLGYAHELLLGFAAIHARYIDAKLHTMVLWDHAHGKHHLGTGAAFNAWERAGHHVDVIDIRKIRAGGA